MSKSCVSSARNCLFSCFPSCYKSCCRVSKCSSCLSRSFRRWLKSKYAREVVSLLDQNQYSIGWTLTYVVVADSSVVVLERISRYKIRCEIRSLSTIEVPVLSWRITGLCPYLERKKPSSACKLTLAGTYVSFGGVISWVRFVNDIMCHLL